MVCQYSQRAAAGLSYFASESVWVVGGDDRKGCLTLALVLAASTRDLYSLRVLAASDLFTLARVASSKKHKLVVKDQVFKTQFLTK